MLCILNFLVFCEICNTNDKTVRSSNFELLNSSIFIFFVRNLIYLLNAQNVFQNLSEGARLQAQLQSSPSLLAKTKEKYEKAFGASERALDAYQRADADLNLSRAEVEKARMHSTVKSQQVRHLKYFFYFFNCKIGKSFYIFLIKYFMEKHGSFCHFLKLF